MDPAPPPEGEIEGDSESEESEKPGFFSTLEPRAQRLMIIVGVVALVVGLLGGFAAGFKVEQNRIKTSTKKAAKAAKTQRITRVAGVATSAAADSFTVADTQGLHVKVLTPSTAVIEKTAKGKASDVVEGGEILLRGKNTGDGLVDATEIIVLPAASKFGGLKVAKVDGNKLTITRSNEKPLTVTITPTSRIYTTSTGKTSDVAKNTEVVIRGSGLSGADTFTAADVIILPPGSGFASAS